MTTQRREHDIKIELTPSGAQYLGIEMDVCGERIHFLASSAVGGQFGELVSALYALLLENGDSFHPRTQIETQTDEKHQILTATARVVWDNEGNLLALSMTRSVGLAIDLKNDRTELVIRDGLTDALVMSHTLKTQELCYAVAKACTEALKTYGVYGYRLSTELDTFHLHQLLYIKALALGDLAARELSSVNGYVWRTSFEKEMELLMLDM